MNAQLQESYVLFEFERRGACAYIEREDEKSQEAEPRKPKELKSNQ